EHPSPSLAEAQAEPDPHLGRGGRHRHLDRPPARLHARVDRGVPQAAQAPAARRARHRDPA
ncbi:MAG: hypothetical protein AVDCRST_MAG79-591, partial [uncultured Thermoleophilia bacterium]